MNNFVIEKKGLKCKNQEAIIKNYVLGYMLECIAQKDYNIRYNIERLLVYELRIISLSMFLNCVQKSRLLNLYDKEERAAILYDKIEIINYDYMTQFGVIERLQSYAENYDNGIYINSGMAYNNLFV